MERRYSCLHFLTIPGGIEDPLTVQTTISMEIYVFNEPYSFLLT